MDAEGGTGQPTSGAGGLSVPLGVHFSELQSAEIRRLNDLREADKELLGERDRRYAAERTGDRLAVSVALSRADELAEKHNDLIRAGERKDENYASKEDVHLMRVTIGRMGAVIAILQLLVIANFVALYVK